MSYWRTGAPAGRPRRGSLRFRPSTNPNSPEPHRGESRRRAEVAAAANGMLIAPRSDMADCALDGGILGREVFRFDGSDPRFTARAAASGRSIPAAALRRRPLGRGVRRHPRTATTLLAVLRDGEPAHRRAAERDRRVRADASQAYNFLIILDAHTAGLDPARSSARRHGPPAPFLSQRRRLRPDRGPARRRAWPTCRRRTRRSRSRCRRASPASTRRPPSSSSTARCGPGSPPIGRTWPACSPRSRNRSSTDRGPARPAGST